MYAAKHRNPAVMRLSAASLSMKKSEAFASPFSHLYISMISSLHFVTKLLCRFVHKDADRNADDDHKDICDEGRHVLTEPDDKGLVDAETVDERFDQKDPDERADCGSNSREKHLQCPALESFDEFERKSDDQADRNISEGPAGHAVETELPDDAVQDDAQSAHDRAFIPFKRPDVNGHDHVSQAQIIVFKYRDPEAHRQGDK